jgi:signal transduction histidine kinase
MALGGNTYPRAGDFKTVAHLKRIAEILRVPRKCVDALFMKRAVYKLLPFYLCSVLTAISADVGALTNVAHIRALARLEANRGRPFELTGIVTLTDRERNLVVLQDETGAIAIHSDTRLAVVPGQLISLSAQAGAPCLPNFPRYPFEPSGRDVLTKCEAPADTGNFHLTRLGGWLQPPATGEYTFFIASDNSSELWLSLNADPSNVRKVASVQSGLWANPREWTRYLSQRSEPVQLKAGVSYYLEVFSEQQEQAEHLAVAWQGPGLKQSIIDGRFIRPWLNGSNNGQPNGILREYWTNFALGTLTAITGERRVESMVSAHGITFRILNTNRWPEPKRLALDDPLTPEDNYRWIRGRGVLDFMSVEGDEATLQIRAGPTRTRVRVRHWTGEPLRPSGNYEVEVEGVCEGARNIGGAIVPGILWADAQNVKLVDVGKTNVSPTLYAAAPETTNAGVGGLFLARGAVTFNGHAFGRDMFVVQDANAGVFIVPPDPAWPGAGIRVGDWVEIAGNLLHTTFAQRLRPAIVNVLGAHVLPEPALPWTDSPPNGLRDGQWTELQGVVRSINVDGSLTFRSRDQTIALWVNNAGVAPLERLIDATVRLRGVVCLDTDSGRPHFLVPSSEFVEMLEPPPQNLLLQLVSTLGDHLQSEFAHRVKIAGVVTYQDRNSFFVQDPSGGVRVKTADASPFKIGDAIEVVGFPQLENSMPTLADGAIRKTAEAQAIKPITLASGDVLASFPNQSLVQVIATLLSHESVENNQVFEVQLGQRVLRAVLPAPSSTSLRLRPGSVLRLTGVCWMESLAQPAGSDGAVWGSSSLGAIRILLRDDADVAVIRGPPWWNLKKVAVLVVVLVVLLAGAILRGQIVRHRFERQQAAQLAFAQKLIENQESERSRIAANLHDSLGQNLLAIKNQAHLALQAVSENAALGRRIEDISTTALSALEEVRQITHDLRPYQLDRLGLRQAIIALVRQVSETASIELACNVDEIDGSFPGDGEINIYRIVQEGVTNVVKHSQATEAAVVLRRNNEHLLISIRDNGRGSRSDDRPDPDGRIGFGLSGIAERARIMGGKMEFATAHEQGFSVNVTIPLPPGGPPAKNKD